MKRGNKLTHLRRLWLRLNRCEYKISKIEVLTCVPAFGIYTLLFLCVLFVNYDPLVQQKGCISFEICTFAHDKAIQKLIRVIWFSLEVRGIGISPRGNLCLHFCFISISISVSDWTTDILVLNIKGYDTNNLCLKISVIWVWKLKIFQKKVWAY